MTTQTQKLITSMRHDLPIQSSQIKQKFEEFGVNMRYLGHVMRETLDSREVFMREEIAKVLQIELFVRCAKYAVLEILR